MKRPLGAQISHMLKDRGVDVIFGIPGVHNQELYRGIEEAGITHVLARHEQGAGFMADGYARATGKPGVAYVITGPGLCNIMTPMGQAYSDSVPMLVISSCLDEVAARKGQLHQMKDQRAAAETVCDWSEEARTAEAAYRLIDRALVEFQTERQRPKHIQVPIAQLQARAPEHPADTPPVAERPAAAEDVTALGDALAQARHPMFVFGGGAVSGARIWRDLVRRLNAASFTTYAGRGVMGEEDPLCLGAYLARPDSVTLLQQADLVVVVGSELAEVDLWRDRLGQTCPLFRIDRDAGEATGASDRAIWGDAHAVAEALSQREDLTRPSGWRTEDIAAARARWRAETDAERPGIVPVADALRDCLPAGTMIYSDMTQFAYTAKEIWDMPDPGHWHHPSGFGTLGYALPAGIGGAVARRGQPTLVIAGDYGFQYTLQELGVAVELGLPLPIILWDNGKLKEIEDSMVRAQIAPNAVIARNPDFCRLAEAYGARSAAPDTLADLQDCVRAAFAADGPTLIHLTPGLAS